ncbi:MAG: zinc metallopeptidase [Candidatus Coproplasma sp.]
MDNFINWVRELSGGAFDGVSAPIIIAMSIVAGLLIIASIFAFGISIYLAVKYVIYNKKKNSCGKSGQEVARDILDRNGLERIKVSSTGSILFGNSYSHYFKKVRLRRLTWKKNSVTSLAMAAQKSALAVLDKEGDKDMKTRIRLTPIIYFGPVMFVPLVVIGALLDILVFTSGNGICTFVLTCIATAIYLLSFVMSILVLKTEKKAQKRALALLKADGLATKEELEDCKKLFRLYNIEYVNDMVIALLELIYRVLQIVAYAQNSSSSSK